MLSLLLLQAPYRKITKATIIFVMSARRSAWNNPALTGRIFTKLYIYVFFENAWRKSKFSWKSDKKNGYFRWRPIYIFLVYLAQFFLEYEIFQTKVVEEIKTHFVINNIYFSTTLTMCDDVKKKIYYSGAGHRWQYGASALHAEFLRLQTRTQNV